MNSRRNPMSAATQVAEALRAAGHAESTVSEHMASTGFMAFPASPSSARVLVTATIGDDVEGHWDSPAHHDAMARLTDGYRQSLEAAGWLVKVFPSGEAMSVAKGA
jgi:hypothetical protein